MIYQEHKDAIEAARVERDGRIKQRVRELVDRGESWATISDDTGLSVYKAKKLVGL